MTDTQDSLKHFEELSQKYQLPFGIPTTHIPSIYSILLKLEENKYLIEEDIIWLETYKYFGFLGNYYVGVYKRVGKKTYKSKANHYLDLHSKKLDELKELASQEVNSEKRIIDLFNKYSIKRTQLSANDYKLYEIIKNIDSGFELSPDQMNWLKGLDYYELLAMIYQEIHSKTRNPWTAIRSGKFWRLAGKPENTLKVISEVENSGINIQSELLELKQGVQRDLLRKNNPHKKYLDNKLSYSSDFTVIEILEFHDSGRNLGEDQIDWLKKKGHFDILGRIYQDYYSKDNDPWTAIRSGKFYRWAGQPENALLVTDGLESTDNFIQAAILTNRGGAYRDQGLLQEARKNVEQAIILQPKSYHALNLLAAICYQEGEPEEGDKLFNKAIELGSSPIIQLNMVRNALNDAQGGEKEVIARYLLKKDSTKYSWVKSYIKPAYRSSLER